MNPSLPKVLIIESAATLQRSYTRGYNLGANAQLLQAYAVDEAQMLFLEHADIAIIAISARVASTEVNTAPLIEYFRKSGFDGPIIAVSKIRKHRQILKAAGANFQSENTLLPEMVRYLLDDMSRNPNRVLRSRSYSKIKLVKDRRDEE